MMDHAQTLWAGASRRPERELVAAMFTTLAGASSFVRPSPPAASSAPAARRASRRRTPSARPGPYSTFDPELHTTLPTFGGWISR